LHQIVDEVGIMRQPRAYRRNAGTMDSTLSRNAVIALDPELVRRAHCTNMERPWPAVCCSESEAFDTFKVLGGRPSKARTLARPMHDRVSGRSRRSHNRAGP
jgi:hypothetical protein